MKVKMSKAGFKPFQKMTAERKRKQLSRERCKAIGVKGPNDPTLVEKVKRYAKPNPQPPKDPGDGQGEKRPVTSGVVNKSVSKSQGGRMLDGREVEQLFTKLFAAFIEELPQLAAAGSGLRQLSINPERADTFARQFATRHRRKLNFVITDKGLMARPKS